MGKLRKEAERVKDILSANTMYKVGIQALHMDRDLLCVVSRADMEARADKLGHWERLKGPMAEVLAQANLTKAEVHRVEVVGGATRIPRVKEAATEDSNPNPILTPTLTTSPDPGLSPSPSPSPNPGPNPNPSPN